MKGITLNALIATQLFTSPMTFASSCPDILQGKQRLLNSTEEIALCDAFKGKTLLVVNTASQCGFTPQFEQLEQLHQAYNCLLYTSPSPRDRQKSRMPSSA